MIIRDIKLFFRILFRTRVLSLINISGLSLGVAACLTISLYIDEELSYDGHHVNKDRIFRITTKFVSEGSVDHTALSSSPLASELKHSYAEVKESVRFLESRNATIQYGSNVYREKNVYKADASVFDVFSHPFLQGKPAAALAGPDRVVLTRSMSRKYFGNEEAVGKNLTINTANYVVTGIIEDLPPNCDLQFDILLSMGGSDSDDWFDFSYYTFVLFHEGAAADKDFPGNFEHKIIRLTDDKINMPLRENDQPVTATLHLQRLTDLHLENALLYDTPKGNKTYIYIFSLAAVFLLLVACFNYINFSVVQSLRRSAEVGIRKVMGATDHQLRCRYIGESVLTTFLAVLLAITFVAFFLPVINTVAGTDFSLSHLVTYKTLVITLVILFALGILAGSYSAFYLSSAKPVSALKGKVGTPKARVIRNGSVTAQFMISLGLIICSGITFRQMTFIKNYDLGFKQNNSLVVNIPADSTGNADVKYFADRLLQSSQVADLTVCGMGALPGGDIERGSVTLVTSGRQDVRMVNFAFVDENYLPFLKIALKDGRNFEGGAVSESKNSAIVNEALVRLMNWSNPLENKILSHGKEREVIGVIKDFNYKSLHHRIEPQVLFYNDEKNMHVLVSFNQQTPISRQVQLLDSMWSTTFQNEPLVYNFLDESLAAQYVKEEKAMHLFTGFSLLTIIISCLGLFGLSTLTVYQRKKEIGIRKIAGAEFTSLILLFSKGYVRLVLLSFILVSPVTWFLMNRWLQNFPYRQPIETSLYLMVGTTAILLSLITIVASSAKLITTNSIKLIGD